MAFPCCCCCAAFLIYKVFKWNNCYFLRKIFFSFLSLNSVFPTKYSFSSRPSKKVFLFYKGCKWKCSSYTKSSNESPPTKLSFTFLLNLSLLQSLKVFLCYENLFFYKIFRFKFSFSLETLLSTRSFFFWSQIKRCKRQIIWSVFYGVWVGWLQWKLELAMWIFS